MQSLSVSYISIGLIFTCLLCFLFPSVLRNAEAGFPILVTVDNKIVILHLRYPQKVDNCV